MRLGELQRAGGAMNDAVATYERAVARAPRSAEALRALASAYVAAERSTEAIEVLVRLVTLRPVDMAANLDLALLYAAKGDRDRAQAHGELALRHARPGERETVESLLAPVVSRDE